MNGDEKAELRHYNNKALDEIVKFCTNFDVLLKDNPNCINVFICADRADRIKRIAERYDVSEKKALDRIKRMDRERKYYYETHTGQEWGSISSHDILLNASLLGIEGTVNVLEGIYKETGSVLR